MKKAQIHFDYMVGFFLFLIVIFFSSFLIFHPTLKNNERVKETQIENAAQRVSELLIKTEGVPPNWEEDVSSLERIGLASEPWVLDSNKVSSLDSLNYSQIKGSLNLGNYQIYLGIKTSESIVKVGETPQVKKRVATVKRHAVLDNQTATLTLMLW